MGAPLAGERKIVWFVLGFAAFLALCSCASPCLPQRKFSIRPRAAANLSPPASFAPHSAGRSARSRRRPSAFDDGRFRAGRESSPRRLRQPPGRRRARPGAASRSATRTGQPATQPALRTMASGRAAPAPAGRSAGRRSRPGRSRRRRRRTALSTSASRRRPSRARRTSPRSTCARPRTCGRSSASPRVRSAAARGG